MEKFKFIVMVEVNFAKEREVDAKNLDSAYTKLCKQVVQMLEEGRLVLLDKKTGQEDTSWRRLDFDVMKDLTILCGKCGMPIMTLSDGKAHCRCETEKDERCQKVQPESGKQD